MTASASSSACKFVWYELMTSNLDAAEAFYKSVVGWSMADAGMPGGRYTLVSAGSDMVGGLMTLPPEAAAMGARPGWVGYVGVDDVDAAAAGVKAAGGAIHRPADDIPGVGRFAVVADPQGAAFVVFKGMGDMPAPQGGADAPGRVGWHELSANDWESALAFYSQHFGWTKVDAMDMGPQGTYLLFATGATAVGGMMNKMPQVPAPFWLFYFNTDDIDAAVARVNAGGGQVVHGPMEVPGGSWIVNCMDPQGAMFALVGPKKA